MKGEQISTQIEAVISDRKAVELQRRRLESTGCGNSPEWQALWTRENELRREQGRLEDLRDEF